MRGFNAAARSAAGGLGDLFRSTLGAGALEAKARRDEESRLAQAFSDTQSGLKSRAQANLLADQRANRSGLGAAVGPLLADLGLKSPNAGPGVQALVGAADPDSNASDLARLFATILNQSRLSRAVDLGPTDRGQANINLAAGGATPVFPHSQNASGVAINRATGAQDFNSPFAQAFLGESASKTAQNLAAAAKSNAGAASTNALSPFRRSLIEAQTNAANARATTTGAAGGVKASDENTIASLAAGLFGGTFDPFTKHFVGLDSNQADQALNLTARAVALFRTGEALDRANAVLMAFKEAQSGLSRGPAGAINTVPLTQGQGGAANAQGGLSIGPAGGTSTVPLTNERSKELQDQISEVDVGISVIDRVLASVAQGTGIGSILKSAINSAAGQAQSLGVPIGAPFPFTAEARSNLRTFERQLVRTLATNNRFLAGEQKIIRDLIPSPKDFSDDPVNAIQELRSLREFVLNKQRDAATQLGAPVTQGSNDFVDVIAVMPVNELFKLDPELLTEAERAALSRRLDELERGGR